MSRPRQNSARTVLPTPDQPASDPATTPDQEGVLLKPQPAFQGVIGRTVKDSKPDFPKGVEAPKERLTSC